jgi:hypothetical protein
VDLEHVGVKGELVDPNQLLQIDVDGEVQAKIALCFNPPDALPSASPM